MEAIGVANLAQQPVRAPLREVNMAQDASDTAEVIAPPPAIYAGGLVLGLLVQRLWPLSPFPVRFARPLGLLLSLASLGVGATALRELRRAGTEVRPTRPTTAIVTSG